MKPLYIIYYVITLFFIYSCNKKNVTRLSLLTEKKKWKKTSIIVKLATGSQTTDGYPDLPEYEKDDYYIFHTDSTYEFNDNELRNPSATSVILEHGFWYFEEDNYLKLFNPGGAWIPHAKIIALTSSELITDTDYGGAIEHIIYKVIE